MTSQTLHTIRKLLYVFTFLIVATINFFKYLLIKTENLFSNQKIKYIVQATWRRNDCVSRRGNAQIVLIRLISTWLTQKQWFQLIFNYIERNDSYKSLQWNVLFKNLLEEPGCKISPSSIRKSTSQVFLLDYRRIQWSRTDENYIMIVKI